MISLLKLIKVRGSLPSFSFIFWFQASEWFFYAYNFIHIIRNDYMRLEIMFRPQKGSYRKGPINFALGPPSGFFQTSFDQKGRAIFIWENIFCAFW